MKNENEKLKSIVEEQNNIIFNYKKQLNNINLKRNYNDLSKNDFNQFKNSNEKKIEIESKNNNKYDYEKDENFNL